MKSVQKVLAGCSHPLPSCHQSRVLHIHQQLLDGVPYTALGGQRIHERKDLIRFKIGREWRLIYTREECQLIPCCLISRQEFKTLLKRRR